jgi:flagellar basal body rod protein FlgG
MIYGMYLSTGGAILQSRRVETIANNLANAATTGFKRDLFLVRARASHDVENGLARPGAGPENVGGGVLPFAVETDFSPGGLEQTGNPLDVALAGDGFFRVSDGEQEYLTRDGNFALDALGNLRLQGTGDRVLDEGGAPIVLSTSLPVEIAADGSVLQGGVPQQRLGVVEPSDYHDLKKVGANRYQSTGPVVAAPGQVQQGFLELSGTNPTNELMQLIEASRAYEANINLIRYHDEALGRLLSDVPRLP